MKQWIEATTNETGTPAVNIITCNQEEECIGCNLLLCSACPHYKELQFIDMSTVCSDNKSDADCVNCSYIGLCFNYLLEKEA